MAKRQRPDRSPIANDNAGKLKATYAPWPQIDRLPTILGSNLTLAYLAAVYRICQQGFRQQYVDVLDELLEKDPHAQGILGQRVLAVAGGRVELVPADTEAGSKDEEKAKEIAEDLQRRVDAIPERTQAFYTLLFDALYYGAGGLEIHWSVDSNGWNVDGLGFIHSRRIAYPDQNEWAVHIWDQGSVQPSIGPFPTQQFYGLRVQDYPGKFIVHTPNFRGDYPTRDGLGRVMGWWMAIKLVAVRQAAWYVERFGQPWAFAYYNTSDNGTDKPRNATEQDIAIADAAVKGIGVGSISCATLPDSIRIELDGPAVKGSSSGITHEKLIDLCDSQNSKAVRGGTLTTDAGDKGARSLGEVHEQGDIRNARYDAATFANRLHDDLVWWLCHLNYPGSEHLCPKVKVHVEKIEPGELLKRASALAAMNAPVDGKALSHELGVKLIDPNDPDAIRLAPLKPADLFALLPDSTRDLAGAIEALAARAGINITPGVQSKIAQIDQDDAARMVQSLLGAAKKVSQVADAEVEDEVPEPGDGANPDDFEPNGGPAPKPKKPATKTMPRARGEAKAPVSGNTPED